MCLAFLEPSHCEVGKATNWKLHVPYFNTEPKEAIEDEIISLNPFACSFNVVNGGYSTAERCASHPLATIFWSLISARWVCSLVCLPFTSTERYLRQDFPPLHKLKRKGQKEERFGVGCLRYLAERLSNFNKRSTIQLRKLKGGLFIRNSPFKIWWLLSYLQSNTGLLKLH